MRRTFMWVMAAVVVWAAGCRPAAVPPPEAEPAVPTLAIPSSPVVDPSAADLETLQGWWEIVEDHDPDAAPGAPPGGWGKGDLLLIEGNKTYLFASYGIQVHNACVCIRLDAMKTPKHMDEWPVKEPGDQVTRTIYRLEGVKLTVVYGTTGPDVRPAGFDDQTKRTLKYRWCPPPKQV